MTVARRGTKEKASLTTSPQTIKTIRFARPGRLQARDDFDELRGDPRRRLRALRRTGLCAGIKHPRERPRRLRQNPVPVAHRPAVEKPLDRTKHAPRADLPRAQASDHRTLHALDETPDVLPRNTKLAGERGPRPTVIRKRPETSKIRIRKLALARH